MDAETFQSGKKNLRIQKCPDTCGRGPKAFASVVSLAIEQALLKGGGLN